MKTYIPPALLRFALIASLAAAPLAHAAEDEGSTASVKLSAPGKPATLSLDMPWADIRITGVDGDTVTVESTLTQKNSKPVRPGGLRRLDDEVSFELTEHDNTVTLRLAGDNPWAGHDAEFKISVPRTMALDLKTDAGGDLVVQGVEGDIEVNNMNGEVRLDGLVGSAVINTMNGEVRAIYAQAPTKPVSITSMNGEVDLRVPADTKANIRLRTHNGSILTDFGEDVLKTKSEGSRHAGYSHAHGAEANAREIARAAGEAARAAVQIGREVSREIARAAKEARAAADEDSVAPTPASTPGAAPAPAAVPRTPRTPRPPIPPITGGKLVTGELNGGGVDIKISTLHHERRDPPPADEVKPSAFVFKPAGPPAGFFLEAGLSVPRSMGCVADNRGRSPDRPSKGALAAISHHRHFRPGQEFTVADLLHRYRNHCHTKSLRSLRTVLTHTTGHVCSPSTMLGGSQCPIIPIKEPPRVTPWL
ncbi:MAG: DUF4097 family beta strand repeat protein [Opitutae bacterium]|nr:DUF4097 family beta strand repeat protein [Opitutae bacterium]